jgi:hypothetical protein
MDRCREPVGEYFFVQLFWGREWQRCFCKSRPTGGDTVSVLDYREKVKPILGDAGLYHTPKNGQEVEVKDHLQDKEIWQNNYATQTPRLKNCGPSPSKT